MRNLLVALAAAALAAGCASSPAPAASSSAASPPTTSPSSSGGDEAAPRPARYLPPPPTPGSTPFSGGDGTSAEEAVVVVARTEDEGIDLEHHWIFDHYGRFRKKAGALASANGKHYDVITVELGDHSEKTIFFDITAFYGVMDAPTPPEAPPPERRDFFVYYSRAWESGEPEDPPKSRIIWVSADPASRAISAAEAPS